MQVPVDTVGEWDHPVVTVAPGDGGGRGDVLWITGSRARRSGNGIGLVDYVDAEERFGRMRVYRPPEAGNNNFGGAVALGRSAAVFTYFTMNQQPPRPLYAVRADPTGFSRTPLRESVTPWGFPMLGAATGTFKSGPPTIFATWLEGTRAQGLDVMIARSTDAGRTWGSPVSLTRGAPRMFRARPNVAVADNGTVAATWFESPAGTSCGTVVVSVSRDGGTSFSRTAQFERDPDACPREGSVAPILERWPGGGDYAPILASGSDAFDLVWAELVDDALRVRFARVSVKPQR